MSKKRIVEIPTPGTALNLLWVQSLTFSVSYITCSQSHCCCTYQHFTKLATSGYLPAWHVPSTTTQSSTTPLITNTIQLTTSVTGEVATSASVAIQTSTTPFIMSTIQTTTSETGEVTTSATVATETSTEISTTTTTLETTATTAYPSSRE